MLDNHTHLMCPTLSSLQRHGFAEKGRQPLTKEAANFFRLYVWNNVEKYETAK